MFSLARLPRRLALIAIVLVVSALVLHPSWGQWDVWNWPAREKELRAEVAETERVRAEDAEVVRRLEIKETIVAELLGRQIALPEATDRFLTLNESRPKCMSYVRATYPGATDREKMARNVIDHALLRVPAQEQPAVSARLEAELRKMLAAGASR
jgi:hypothetical protein